MKTLKAGREPQGGGAAQSSFSHQLLTPRFPSPAASEWGSPGGAECLREPLMSLPEAVWPDRNLGWMFPVSFENWPRIPVDLPGDPTPATLFASPHHTVPLGFLLWCGSLVLEVGSSPSFSL